MLLTQFVHPGTSAPLAHEPEPPHGPGRHSRARTLKCGFLQCLDRSYRWRNGGFGKPSTALFFATPATPSSRELGCHKAAVHHRSRHRDVRVLTRWTEERACVFSIEHFYGGGRLKVDDELVSERQANLRDNESDALHLYLRSRLGRLYTST